jgi:hypothetical protein
LLLSSTIPKKDIVQNSDAVLKVMDFHTTYEAKKNMSDANDTNATSSDEAPIQETHRLLEDLVSPGNPSQRFTNLKKIGEGQVFDDVLLGC